MGLHWLSTLIGLQNFGVLMETIRELSDKVETSVTCPISKMLVKHRRSPAEARSTLAPLSQGTLRPISLLLRPPPLKKFSLASAMDQNYDSSQSFRWLDDQESSNAERLVSQVVDNGDLYRHVLPSSGAGEFDLDKAWRDVFPDLAIPDSLTKLDLNFLTTASFMSIPSPSHSTVVAPSSASFYSDFNPSDDAPETFAFPESNPTPMDLSPFYGTSAEAGENTLTIDTLPTSPMWGRLYKDALTMAIGMMLTQRSPGLWTRDDNPHRPRLEIDNKLIFHPMYKFASGALTAFLRKTDRAIQDVEVVEIITHRITKDLFAFRNGIYQRATTACHGYGFRPVQKDDSVQGKEQQAGKAKVKAKGKAKASTRSGMPDGIHWVKARVPAQLVPIEQAGKDSWVPAAKPVPKRSARSIDYPNVPASSNIDLYHRTFDSNAFLHVWTETPGTVSICIFYLRLHRV